MAKKKRKEETYSVCRWVKEVYLKDFNLPIEILDDMKLRPQHVQFFDHEGYINRNDENIEASNIGTIVDTCCRYLLTHDTELTLAIIRKGFLLLKDIVNLPIEKTWENEEFIEEWEPIENREYYKMHVEKDQPLYDDLWRELEFEGLTDHAIVLICAMMKYNNFFRAGFEAFKDIPDPSESCLKNIRKMAERGLKFLEKFENVQAHLSFWSFDQCKKIKAGDGDYYNKDIMFDMKVQNSTELWPDGVIQQIVYYLLSKKYYEFVDGIIFNPRLGCYYEYQMKNIPQWIIDDIKSKW